MNFFNEVFFLFFFFFNFQTEIHTQGPSEYLSKELCRIHPGTTVQNIFTGNELPSIYNNYINVFYSD